MARVRFAVALLLPDEVTAEIDGIRRAFGVDTGYIPPHVTVVPPVNVSDAQVADALGVLRDAAAETATPLTLTIGPFDTFLPHNPVLYLGVGGEVDRLEGLRAGCLAGPLHREDERAYVPHVTITRGLRPDDDATVRRLLDGYRREVVIDRLHLLAQVAAERGGRRWVPSADVVFEPRRVIGAGGLELELTVSELAPPDLRRCAAEHEVDPGQIGVGPGSFVVTGSHDGIVGFAWGRRAGWTAALDGVFVVPDWRHRGVAAHLVATVEHHAVRRGATVIEAPAALTPAVQLLLDGRGWTERPGPGGGRMWRALAPDSPRVS